jgi:hypothetical protein
MDMSKVHESICPGCHHIIYRQRNMIIPMLQDESVVVSVIERSSVFIVIDPYAQGHLTCGGIIDIKRKGTIFTPVFLRRRELEAGIFRGKQVHSQRMSSMNSVPIGQRIKGMTVPLQQVQLRF